VLQDECLPASVAGAPWRLMVRCRCKALWAATAAAILSEAMLMRSSPCSTHSATWRWLNCRPNLPNAACALTTARCGGSLPVAATRAKKDCAGGLEHFYRMAWLNLDHPRNRDMHVPGDRLNDIQFGQRPKQLGMRF